MTSVFLFSLIQETGFPPGTMNLILGDGKIGSLLTGNDKISAISLTGSTQTGALIKKQISDLNTRFQAEMGGKNTVAVLADADIESAAIDIATNAYACCGQWCTGTSKVVVHSEVAEHLTNLIVEFAGKIKLGNGLERNADMGPLISEVQLDKVKTAVKNNDGAELLFGGKQPSDEKLRNGYFFEPTVFSNVDPNSNLAKEEIFGPVLSIIVEDDLDNMIADVNNTNYGLSFSVYTGIESAGERFINEVEAGLCHLNLPTAYRDPSLPLLGWKNSGYGLPEAGRFALDFFTKPKAVYRKEE